MARKRFNSIEQLSLKFDGWLSSALRSLSDRVRALTLLVYSDDGYHSLELYADEDIYREGSHSDYGRAVAHLEFTFNCEDSMLLIVSDLIDEYSSGGEERDALELFDSFIILGEDGECITVIDN